MRWPWGHNGYRFTKALSKKQKKILACLDAADDIVNSLVTVTAVKHNNTEQNSKNMAKGT